MLQCDIEFHQDPKASANNRQADLEPTKNYQRPCFISLANYQLTFFENMNNSTAFYELNIGEYISKLNSNTSSMTLTHKRADNPLLTIYAADSTLAKIQSTFSSYSPEKGAWNLLMNTPYHIQKDSYLTHLGKESNSKGMITLVTIIAVFGIARDIINNHMTYGLLPMPKSGKTELIMAAFSVSCFIGTIALMMLIEKLAFKDIISNRIAALFEMLNILQVYALPVYFCRAYKPEMSMGGMYVTLALGSILKIISYTHFMHDLRRILPTVLHDSDPKQSLVTQISSENLAIVRKHVNNPSGFVNVKDILYFFFAPVLVYQLWYPRTERINKGRAARLFGELILTFVFIQYWTNQHITPVLKTSTEAYINGQPIQMLERFLASATVYLIILIADGFGYFHALPNFLSEILRFGNREFYKDWWNSDNVKDFWNHWNLPVHRWCVRHVYNPIQKHGYSTFIATCGVFLFSGVMHDYLLSTPLGFASICLTLTYFFQAPSMFLQDRFNKKFGRTHLGNVYIWVGCWVGSVTFILTTLRIQYLQNNP